MDISGQIRDKGLKATPARLDVFRVLSSDQLAYSHADLETLFNQMDRVTLYRVLKDFEDAGLVHKIIDIQGVTRFALCRHSCPDEHHTDDHVHFNCQNCHRMFCFEQVHVPQVSVPRGFKIKGLHTLIYGICKSCSAA